MLSQSPQEVLVPLPKNSVLVGVVCEEAALMHSRPLNLSANNRSP
jgi:hypothetical protein